MDPLTPSTFMLNAQIHYKFTRLPDDSSYVRLVTVRLVALSKKGGRSLVATLEHHPVAELPEYDALSYEWGKPGDHAWITVDNRPFRIQRNLAAFLNAIVSTASKAAADSPVVLFVDAICVDQENIAERNQQVQLMKDIYSNANRVLSWLGPPIEGTADLFKLLEGTQLELSRNQLEKLFLRLHGSQDRFRIHAALEDLMHRTYWSRLWIVQELILAKEIILYCGTCCIEWTKMDPNSLIEVAKLFKNDRYTDVEKAKIASGAGSKDFVKTFYKELMHEKFFTYMCWRGGWDRFYGSGLSLDEYDTLYNYKKDLKHALLDFGRNECFDPRDRIYALLGIVQTEPEQKKIVVNYAQNLIGLFYDTWDYVSELDALKEYRSVRAFARNLFTRLGLEEYVLEGEQGSLRPEVLESIPSDFRHKELPVTIWRAGKLDRLIASTDGRPPFPLLDRLEADSDADILSTWSVKRTFSSQYDDFWSFRKGVDFLCFTLARAKRGDTIIGLDSSHCGIIARETDSDDSGPYTFVGRCVFARSTDNILTIGHFLQRKLSYCRTLEKTEGFERPASSGDFEHMPAEDLLTLSIDLDPDLKLKPAR